MYKLMSMLCKSVPLHRSAPDSPEVSISWLEPPIQSAATRNGLVCSQTLVPAQWVHCRPCRLNVVATFCIFFFSSLILSNSSPSQVQKTMSWLCFPPVTITRITTPPKSWSSRQARSVKFCVKTYIGLIKWNIVKKTRITPHPPGGSIFGDIFLNQILLYPKKCYLKLFF